MLYGGLWRSSLGISGRAIEIARNVYVTATRASSSHQLIFNKRVRKIHLDISSESKDAHVYDYLKDHIAKELCDRIDDLKLETKLDIVYNLGSCSGLVTKHLNPERLNTLVQSDISSSSLARCKKLNLMLPREFAIHYLQCDEEAIPLKENSVDLAMSCLDLHWVNDLIGCFKQIRNALEDNRAFIGAMFGGDTLYELRSSLQLAEMERLSGFSAHVAPQTTGQDVATLLQSSGFQLITVDISELKIHYPSMFELMFDLQGMGENNASLIGSQHMHRDILQSAASIYQTMYGDHRDLDGGVPATFQVIHFIGWKNPSQSTPLKSAPQH